MKFSMLICLSSVMASAPLAWAQPTDLDSVAAPIVDPSDALPVDGADDEVVAVAADAHQASITWSPIMLLRPTVELTGEYRLLPKLGAGVIVGAGKLTLTAPGLEIEGKLISFGAQARYYLLGGFDHGMQLGGEVLYEYFSPTTQLSSTMAVAAGGGTAGAFAGYKIVADVGFTFEFQLGYQYLVLLPEVHGSKAISQEMVVGSGGRGRPLANINFGWSF